MRQIPHPRVLPIRQGVSPSCVAVPVGSWPTLLDFLNQRLPTVGRTEWVRRMRAGEVVDEYGQPVTPERAFAPHLRLYYYRQIDDEPVLPFSETLLFRDEHLLVVDKPHFMPVVPSGPYLHQTLLVRLKQQLGLDHLSPIHRIDRETAGLVLFSVQPQTRGAYQGLFRERQVQKYYEALAPWRADLSFPLRRQSRIVESEQFFRCCEVPGEPNADTSINVQEVRGPWALYHLKPITGKRHQLRIHMNALGIPIHNDHFYPEVNDPPLGDYSQPLQLLAKGLSFQDPVTGKRRDFESRLQLSWPLISKEGPK